MTVFVASKWWPNNHGHVLVVPNEHYENLYELPVHLAGPIHYVTQLVAHAMKEAYGCDGISTRLHNERQSDTSGVGESVGKSLRETIERLSR
ncbi:bis(5'-nucleosyl)-tetraphosphatase [Geomicrobium sp. JCM 19039]|nr:bis(5'-nucleosyl)-tetraphosphatase [Geomicrobium sp. JCM 19039]